MQEQPTQILGGANILANANEKPRTKSWHPIFAPVAHTAPLAALPFDTANTISSKQPAR